jgi:hypothetical protein
MSIAFFLLGWMLEVTTPSAVLLLVCVGLGGWGCPISLSEFCIRTASCALMYNAPSSALAAQDVTALKSCAILSTVPLLLGSFVSDDVKRFHPA